MELKDATSRKESLASNLQLVEKQSLEHEMTCRKLAEQRDALSSEIQESKSNKSEILIEKKELTELVQ